MFFAEVPVTLNVAISLRTQVKVSFHSGDQHLLQVDGQTKPALSEDLFSEVIRLYEPIDHLLFEVASDIPRASGLGGSSVLMVAVITALRQLGSPERYDSKIGFDLPVLDVVNILEHRLLGKPAGTQDSIAAFHGGLSCIDLLTGTPKRSEMVVPDFLKEALYLVHAPIEHHSGINNWEVVKRACEGDWVTMKLLSELGENALRMRDALVDQDVLSFAEMLRLEVELREQLCEGLTPDILNSFLEPFGDAVIGKMCGAGGGGCMFLWFNDVDPADLERAAIEKGLQWFPVAIEDLGVKTT
jgi:D-glycero-alpha-D-manno-heptose-7-phosphate kinase